MENIDFAGQVAIITGAGRGLGLSHAELLASRGARVVINDVAGAEEAATAIREAGGEATANADDISTPEGAAALVKATVDAYGTVDILVNNAGIGRFTTLSDVTIDEYEFVRRVGLDGSFYVTKEVWPIFAEKRYGRIIITTSANGLLGNPSSISYSMSKAGVFGLMRSAAIDGADIGIKVNSIGPSASTPMAESFVSGETAAWMRETMPTSLVSPIVAVLASEQCPVTGQHFDAGAGRVGTTFLSTAPGYYDRDMTPESLLNNWSTVIDQSGAVQYSNGNDSAAIVQIAQANSEKS